MLNFCDFIQVYVFTTNHHLKGRLEYCTGSGTIKETVAIKGRLENYTSRGLDRETLC